jgi:hypothetical protein
MEKIEITKYKILSIALIVAIVAVIIFLIVPKFFPEISGNSDENIDFSNSEWIEQYVEENIGELFGKDFLLSSAFSYNLRSNKMIVTYASQKSVEEIRNYYLSLSGAEQIGRNDETSLNISAESNGQKLRVYNYYSSISRVIEVELTLDAVVAEQVISELESAFPADEVGKISEINDLISGERFGGYVRYHYDNFDEFAHPYIPIYSRAYIYDGTEDDFNRTIAALNEAYTNNKYDETQNTHYYKFNGQISSLSFFVTDSNEKIVSISVQKDENQE